jgi:hypothetical protein
VDGAPLDDHMGHVTVGFKICDKEATCPISGKYIFSELKNIQSSKRDYPIIMLLAKDNKDTYDNYIHPIFEFTEKMRTQGFGEWLPFSVAELQAMKSLHLCLMQGGAVNGQSYFCHLCQIQSDNITVRKQVCCSVCGSLEKCFPGSIALSCKHGTICPISGPIMPMTESPCFYHPMIEDNFIKAAKRELEGLQALATVQELTVVCSKQREEKKKTKWAVLYDKCEVRLVADGIRVQIDNACLFPTRYEHALFRTMRLLGLWDQYFDDPLHQQVLLVHRALHLVRRMQCCLAVLGFGGSVSHTMMRVENAVPCVLYFHKRVMEKCMQLILILALNECEAQTINQRLRRARRLVVVLNETAFGSPEGPCQYHVPMNDKDGTLGDIKFVGGWAKRLEHVFVFILPRCVLKPDQSKLSQWGEYFQDLSEIMTNLRKHDDFSDFDIDCIGPKINAWAPSWIALIGTEGKPNYTHVLTSGHIMIYYLKSWSNLYRFSNQGWENLNASIWHVYHHRSQQRGSAGTK